MMPRLSIIIPIYNGATCLATTLDGLCQQTSPGMLVILALNGCSDSSARIAENGAARVEASGGKVRVLSLQEASRPAALSAADDVAAGDRIYLDQDAVLRPGALGLMEGAFAAGAKFVGGRASWRTPSPWVAAAMRAWGNTAYVRESPVTAGLYGVSDDGRKRWAQWPAALPDDKFARLHFEPAERVALPSILYEVEGPHDWLQLVRVRRRYRAYNAQLTERAPWLLTRDIPRAADLGSYLLNPTNWLGAGVFALAELAALRRPHA